MAEKCQSADIFKQDNASVHTAGCVKQFLDEKKITVLERPANSPVLNPIENLWGILEIAVAKRFPKSKQELILCSKEEWESIAQETLENLIALCQSS